MSAKRDPSKRDAPKQAEPSPLTPDRSALDFIAADLRMLAIPIDEARADRQNVKRHGPKDLQAVKASLQQYGQLKPIVVERETGRILAGHGVHAAAKLLGWTHVAAVRVDFDPLSQRGFTIADNRASELSCWDPENLEAALTEMQEAEAIFLAGFRDIFSLDEILVQEAADAENVAPEVSDASPQLAGTEFRIIVLCESEAQQAELLAQFEEDGLKCRALIT